MMAENEKSVLTEKVPSREGPPRGKGKTNALHRRPLRSGGRNNLDRVGQFEKKSHASNKGGTLGGNLSREDRERGTSLCGGIRK